MLEIIIGFGWFVGIVFGQEYFVDKRLNCNNVWGSVSNGTSTEYIKFLGLFNTTQECIDACVLNSTNELRCETYTYHTSQFDGESFRLNCFGRFGYPLWTPVEQDNINCGRIIWNCQSDMDCSLNGKCQSNGNCTCRTGWSGYKCDTLNLLDGVRNTGYNITESDGNRTSSWGAAVLVDVNDTNDDTKYHMYLAEFNNHCGVNSWTLNSVVTHAQSTKGLNGPFKRVDVIHEHFAHEPDAIYGPNGEIVIYYSTFDYGNMTECTCWDGSTRNRCYNKLPNPAKFIEVMQYSNGMNGPWSEIEVVFPVRTMDTNLAGIIKPDGSFVGFLRIWTTGSEIHLVTASDWKNGTTYTQQDKILFPELTPILTEDPFLYMDCNGGYHAIFHNMSPNDIQTLCGGHAYSTDGINWVYGGAIFGNTVNFTDGTTKTYSRRERPHFVFGDDGCTPIALTNGVQYGGEFGDATFSLLQPVKH